MRLTKLTACRYFFNLPVKNLETSDWAQLLESKLLIVFTFVLYQAVKKLETSWGFNLKKLETDCGVQFEILTVKS